MGIEIFVQQDCNKREASSTNFNLVKEIIYSTKLVVKIVFCLFVLLNSSTFYSQYNLVKNQYYRIEGIKFSDDSLNICIADSCHFFIKILKKKKFEIRVSDQKDFINTSFCFEWKNGKIENKFSPYCYSKGKAKQKRDLIYFDWKKGIENVHELFSISKKTIFSKFYRSMNSALKIVKNSEEILLVPLYPSPNKCIIILKEGDFKIR